MDFLVRLLINAAVLLLLANLMKDVKIKSYLSSILVCLLIGLLNSTIGFLLRLPLNLVTLFLLTFFVRLFVSVIMIKLASKIYSSFEVKSWSAAFIIATCLAIVSYLSDKII